MTSAARSWLVVAAVAAAGIAAAAASPVALRRAETFRVRTVEVSGTRYLNAEQAVAASGISAASSVFDDFDRWRDALLDHPLVASARIERRLPDTLRFEIVEAEAIALARMPELQPVDARGRLLPLSMAGADIDLPILNVASRVSDAGFVDPPAVALVRALDGLREHQPELASWISEIEPVRGSAIRLRLRWPENAEVMLPAEVDSAGLQQLGLAIAHLAATGDNGGTELDRLVRMDARYRDELVVSLRPATHRPRPRATS
jgi:cell division protein FtsQ